jgi:hypothetical protein
MRGFECRLRAGLQAMLCGRYWLFHSPFQIYPILSYILSQNKAKDNPAQAPKAEKKNRSITTLHIDLITVSNA